MDIINLPRRSVVPRSSVVLKPTNCGPQPPSARVPLPSAVSKSLPRSVVTVEDGSQCDETLKPTDVLVQLVDTL